jgi:hypothetical protein
MYNIPSELECEACKISTWTIRLLLGNPISKAIIVEAA